MNAPCTPKTPQLLQLLCIVLSLLRQAIDDHAIEGVRTCDKTGDLGVKRFGLVAFLQGVWLGIRVKKPALLIGGLLQGVFDPHPDRVPDRNFVSHKASPYRQSYRASSSHLLVGDYPERSGIATMGREADEVP